MIKKFCCYENKGFTIIEVMVAMIVLAIGLLGMAGITLMVIKGGYDASRITYGTHLASDKMESLKDQTWANLGTGTPCTQSTALAKTYGCTGKTILIETGLNEQGLTSGEGGTGPFPFTRKWVVCTQGGTAKPASSNWDRCNTTDVNNVPPELTCDSPSVEVQTNEKKIKILVVWRDKKGACHRVDMKSVLVNLG